MRLRSNRSRALAYLTLSALPAVTPAAPREFQVCTDFHCDDLVAVRLDARQWSLVRSVMKGNDDPAGERERLAAAIALLESQVGDATGTWRDRGGNFSGIGGAGQLDCIAESRNTTTYLRLLEDDGLMRWHQVAGRERRNPLIFNVHWTAVVVDRSTGAAYAIDSWYEDNGKPPRVQPLEEWRSGRRPDGRQKDLGHQ